MFNNPSQRAYAIAEGTVPTNGAVIFKRDPTPNDVNYPIGQFWINQSAIRLWYLNTQSNATSLTNPAGNLQSTWELISVSTVLASLSDTAGDVVFPTSSSATPPDNIQLVGGTNISVVATPGSNLLTISSTGAGAETLTGDDGVAVSPTLGTIQTIGNTVANATHAKPLYTHNPSGNIEEWDIQVAAAIASTNINSTGLAAFSNTQFSVDANGFVTLKGGSGSPTLGLTPDAFTAPGTSPVVPNFSGNIILEGGATYATGTRANPIRTNSLAANTVDLQIQLAGANAGTATANGFGVAQFDSNSFGVSSGFVTLLNAGTTGPITKVNLDAGTSPILPTAGAIVLTGGQIAAGSTANVIRTDGTSSNTATIQIQRAQAVATSTIGDNGVSHFNSAQFSVDANGFVSLSGGSGSGILTVTGDTGGAVGPTSGNINLHSATTTYVTGTPGTSSLKTEVVSTANTFLYGQGPTTPSVALGPLTNGQLIIGSTGSAPVAATLTAGTGITVTNAAGSITIAATGSGDVVGIVPDTHTAPGTSPVTPNGSGNIIIEGGATFTTGTQANPIRTNSLAANTIDLQIQLAGANPTTSTPNNFGVAQFNSNNFGVSGGYVSSNNFTINTGAGLSGGGTITLGGSLTLVATGATSFAYTNVNHAASPYSVTLTNQYLSVDASGGTVTLEFPNTPPTYQYWIVKDRTGSASTNNISLTTVGGTVTIDGETTYTLASNYAAVYLLYNGTTYEVF
jgi:hypothetical protein